MGCHPQASLRFAEKKGRIWRRKRFMHQFRIRHTHLTQISSPGATSPAAVVIEQPQMAADDAWKNPHFRQCVVAKIDEAVQMSGIPRYQMRTSVEMENYVFQKAKIKEEYLAFVAKLILHLREMNSKKGAADNAPGINDTNN